MPQDSHPRGRQFWNNISTIAVVGYESFAHLPGLSLDRFYEEGGNILAMKLERTFKIGENPVTDIFSLSLIIIRRPNAFKIGTKITPTVGIRAHAVGQIIKNQINKCPTQVLPDYS